MKDHRRRGRGFTLKCTTSALGGKLDDSGKLIPGQYVTNTLKYARRRVTPVHEESASEEGWLCINRRSVSLKPASETTNSNVTYLTSVREKTSRKHHLGLIG